MLRPLKFLAWPAVMGLMLAAGMGCPKSPPSYLPTFIITPKQLDFGSNTDSLQFTVAKNYTSQPLPQLTLDTGSDDWIVCTPNTGNSSGPNDKAVITVTLDRSKMDVGANSGKITVSAPGVVTQEVSVRAESFLVADFSASPLLADVNETIQFVDESVVAPQAGPIVSWLWTFGDGKTSTQINPKHKYKNPGTYTVTLNVQTANRSDTRVRQNYIVVEDAGGVDAEFEASTTTPLANTPVEFTDLSTGNVTSWFWTFGDGGTSTQQNPSHTYTTVGKFTVTLTVESPSGASSAEVKTNYIDVQPVGPTANFIVTPRRTAVGEIVQFTDLSDPGTSPITSWLWLFGDGGQSTAQNPVYIYSAAGIYDIYLTVTTIVGSDSEFRIDHVTVDPAP